jgi:hypothetical protein
LRLAHATRLLRRLAESSKWLGRFLTTSTAVGLIDPEEDPPRCLVEAIKIFPKTLIASDRNFLKKKWSQNADR